jgi:putative oxidoreductase
MTALLRAYARLAAALTRAGLVLVPTLARLAFAGVLLVYYWRSASTKLGEGLLGIFHPSVGAYAQIFPRQMEAVTYDIDKLTLYHWAVVEGGMLAEFLLPTLIVLGLLTRPAALAMIGFVALQTGTDLVAFGVAPGTWFDGETAGVLDQRGFWIFTLVSLVCLGGGPLSLDRILGASFNRATGHAAPAPIRP